MNATPSLRLEPFHSLGLVGEIYFTGATSKFSLARALARSKPLVGTAAEPEDITLTTSLRSALGGTIVIEATDGCYQLAAGQPYSLTTPIGGTTNGSVSFTETVDLTNQPFAAGTLRYANTLGPYPAGAVSGKKVAGPFTAPDPPFVSLDKKLTVTHPSGTKLTTMTAGGDLAAVPSEKMAEAAEAGNRSLAADLLFARIGDERWNSQPANGSWTLAPAAADGLYAGRASLAPLPIDSLVDHKHSQPQFPTKRSPGWREANRIVGVNAWDDVFCETDATWSPVELP